ncbi:hypothetical protein CAOG_009452 [Capsaspora owczarzaki ATCC 30864]|uniref:Uncharacterized protein n=1 Tax=Capsaspora owczarzaki (strain ATCC 30864) TaxID=595528 RepID=A0A0D2VK08_CAPO3|nr:hypothetical protein CAOG_009452 [Capsaspora owczarzaki ATCC 30864]
MQRQASPHTQPTSPTKHKRGDSVRRIRNRGISGSHYLCNEALSADLLSFCVWTHFRNLARPSLHAPRSREASVALQDCIADWLGCTVRAQRETERQRARERESEGVLWRERVIAGSSSFHRFAVSPGPTRSIEEASHGSREQRKRTYSHTQRARERESARSRESMDLKRVSHCQPLPACLASPPLCSPPEEAN